MALREWTSATSQQPVDGSDATAATADDADADAVLTAQLLHQCLPVPRVDAAALARDLARLAGPPVVL